MCTRGRINVGGREGDRILISTGENSSKAKNTRRDPRVALSVVDFDNPNEKCAGLHELKVMTK